MSAPFMLWANVEINGRLLGKVEVRCLSHLGDDPDPEMLATYTVWRDGRLEGTLIHRARDHEWMLFSQAILMIAMNRLRDEQQENERSP